MLDCQRVELRCAGDPVELARQAFELLVYLVEHRERVVSRRELLEELWSDRVVTDNALSQAIAAVRRGIETHGAPPMVETVYGKGFRFVAEVEALAAETPPLAAAERPAAPSDPAEAERRLLAARFGPMLSDLIGDLRPVRLFAVTRRATDAVEASILSLYTALELSIEVSSQSGRADEAAPLAAAAGPAPALALAARIGDAVQEDLRHEAAALPESERVRRRYRRRARAVEAAAVAPRLVITGAPGSGKSTLVQHLALCLAGSILGHEEAHVGRLRARWPHAQAWMPWEQRPLLPIYVEVGALAASPAFAGSTGEDGTHQLFAYLRQRDAGRAEQSEALERQLQECEGDGALLILDGLDEAAVRESAGAGSAEGTRERIKQVIRSFVNRFARARVIVTSRPYAYEPGSPWRLDAQGFEEVQLAPFSAAQVREFCAHWYAGMAERRLIPADHVARRAEALARELATQSYLVGLTERPLTLTMLADLHVQDGSLPTTRAALFEESTVLFLNRWNAARKSERPDENGLTVELRIGLEELRRAVEHLAYEAQRTASPGDAPGPAVLRAGQVIDVLFAHGAKGEAERVLDFLAERSGILLSDSRYHYRFPHRSYQEYLAACHLTYCDFPGQLISDVRVDPERWREVLPLAIGRTHAMPYMAIALIAPLLDSAVPQPSERPEDAEDRLHFLAYLCAAGIQEAGLRRQLEMQSPSRFQRLRELLLAGLRSGRAPERDRAAAADLLGQFGDPRFAELERVPIAGGRFWMGAQAADPAAPCYHPDAAREEGPVYEVLVAPFELGRYPVTVSQYARFLAEDGYTRPELWHPVGWAFRERAGIKEPVRWSEQQRYPSRPINGISAHEAEAFARWAGGRLPTEAEWEFAARGGRDWSFPWGEEEPTDRHACFGERFAGWIAVGIYPLAAQRNPWGIFELVGNISQWCLPFVPGESRSPDELAARGVGPLPPVRGGWFAAPPRFLRSAMRSTHGAEARGIGPTLRVAWSVSRLAS